MTSVITRVDPLLSILYPNCWVTFSFRKVYFLTKIPFVLIPNTQILSVIEALNRKTTQKSRP
ncbi:hypothetical protein HanRHA438_Chr02g0062351 [Helianthus annuus]|nr:hypothetical protein HanRHA438_Chr02g0062351 [Helianthus annuus]